MQIIFQGKCLLKLRLYKLNLYNLCGIILVTLYASFSGPAYADNIEQADRMMVFLNQAHEIILPDHAASVLIGSAEFIDIMAQSGSRIIVAGKRVGETNLIIRDQDHHILADIPVIVREPDTRQLSIYRGTARIDYSCLSHCQVTSTPSDITGNAEPKVEPVK